MNNKAPSRRGVRFFLAEDVRQETGGKFSLLGVFAGEKIFVSGTPPEVPSTIAFGLPSLAFVFVLTEGEGRFEGRFRLVAPDRKTVLTESTFELMELRRGHSNTIATTAKPFVGAAFGTYTAELTVGKTRFKFPIEIAKAADEKKK
jgi:hypothetical protein